MQPALLAARRPLLALSFALLALGAFAVQAQDQRSPAAAARDHDGRGALAVLRRDGVLFPFASFNRDSWRVTWPVHLGPYLEIPATQEAIPKDWWGTRLPDQWRAHLTTGDEVSLEVKAPEVFQSFCGPRLGVRTTYRPREPIPPVRVDPFPKDGLAISGGVPLEPIESVSSTSPEWPMMMDSLVGHFNRVEDETLKKVQQRAGWRHPIPVEVRRAAPIRLESWYRSPSGEPGWTVSYVEAVRQYPPGPEDKGCGLETLVSGWMHHRDGKLVQLRVLNEFAVAMVHPTADKRLEATALVLGTGRVLPHRLHVGHGPSGFARRRSVPRLEADGKVVRRWPAPRVPPSAERCAPS